MTLSKTDKQLQEEQQLILCNRNKLIVGQRYTYKQLVDVLGILPRDGNAKPRQIKRIRNYIEWGKDTEYIVLNNALEIGIFNEVVTKGKNSIYFKDISIVILYKLVNKCLSNIDDEYIIRLSRNQAIRLAELVSEDFSLATTYTRQVLADTLKLSVLETHQYISYIKSQAVSIFISACNELEKKEIICIDQNLLIMYRDKETDIIKVASQLEIEEITKAEETVLANMKLKSYYHAHVTNKWAEFRKNVCSHLGIINYWANFDISIKYQDIEKLLEEIGGQYNKSRINLKRNFANSISSSKAKVLQIGGQERMKTINRLNDIFIFGTNDNFRNDIREVDEIYKEIYSKGAA